METEKINIKIKGIGELEGYIFFHTNPETAKAILNSLPIKSRVKRWGKEIYFSIPVEVSEEKPVSTVKKGDIAYWPPGKSLCIFFGPTPITKEGGIKPASPVNVIGKITKNIETLNETRDGMEILIEKVT